MLSRKRYFGVVCAVALLAAGGGLAFGLNAPPDFFLPRLKWHELKAILKQDDVAKRRVKLVTLKSADYPSKDYPHLVVELVDPETTVRVDADQLPFMMPSKAYCSLETVNYPINPRIEWVFSRCRYLRMDFQERMRFMSSLNDSIVTVDVITDGKDVGAHPGHVSRRRPDKVSTWNEAKP